MRATQAFLTRSPVICQIPDLLKCHFPNPRSERITRARKGAWSWGQGQDAGLPPSLGLESFLGDGATGALRLPKSAAGCPP